MKSIIPLILSILISSNLMAQDDLVGQIRSEGEVLIGVNLMVEGTINGSVSDVKGNFTIHNVPNVPYTLIINPCCTCMHSTEIEIQRPLSKIEIKCNCKKSKVLIKKHFLEKGQLKTKKARIRI